MSYDVSHIRRDFPILGESVNNRPLVYFDSGATAQKPLAVINRMDELMRRYNANIHRGVHHLSGVMTDMYEQARESVRRFIGAEHREEVIFTAGATASINLVAQAWSAKFLREGDNIVVSEMEHHSNIVPWQLAAERHGAELRVLPFDDRGDLRLDMLDELIDERTRLVAVTEASNTLGTCPVLDAIIAKAHSVGAVAMVDGCQGVVHGGGRVAERGYDFYAFSGHKLYGPTGIGVLYGRRELLEAMPPYMGGGDMVDKVTFAKTTYAPLPLKYEAGTSNFIGAVALAEAIAYVEGVGMANIEAHEQKILRMMTERLGAIEGLRIYGTSAQKCPIVSFTVDGTHPYDVGMILDKLGVAIRTGHHCAEPVMTHYGVTGMCRASIGMYNTHDEVEVLAKGVERAVRMLK
ncbi:MAG: SufS family cysteine desulfurase [Rikenellaceae bacterium]|nr:SufS family cysteine desulfurase [Rikenellaceae bacterium]